jgi:hypothetical protein
LDLPAPEEEDAAQYHVGHTLGMLLGVCERQRASPRPTEELPALDPEVFADSFHVVDQVPGRIIAELRMGSAAAAAPLIEEDDAVRRRVPEPAMHRARTPARPAMHENGRLSFRVTALLVVDRMNRIDLKARGLVRLDLWKQACHWQRPSQHVG